MLVQAGAVELGEAVGVGGEVGRHPVQDHADAGGAGGLDEGAEILRPAEARGGRIEAGGLVAPGAVEGVLVHRHQLEVGEAHVDHVGDQPPGEFGKAQPFAPPRCAARAQVHLVDADRCVEGVGAAAGVVDGDARQQALHHRGGAGRISARKAKGRP